MKKERWERKGEIQLNQLQHFPLLSYPPKLILQITTYELQLHTRTPFTSIKKDLLNSDVIYVRNEREGLQTEVCLQSFSLFTRIHLSSSQSQLFIKEKNITK